MFIFLTITSLFVVIRRSDLRTNERTNFVTYIYINEGQIQRLKVFSFLLFILGFQDLTFSPFFLQPTLRGEKGIRHFDRPLYLHKSFQKKTHTFLSSRHHGAIDRELRFRGLVPPDGSVGKVDEKDAVLSQGTRARLCRRFKDSFLFRVGTITPIIIRKTRIRHRHWTERHISPKLQTVKDIDAKDATRGGDARKARDARLDVRRSNTHAFVRVPPFQKAKGRRLCLGFQISRFFFFSFCILRYTCCHNQHFKRTDD